MTDEQRSAFLSRCAEIRKQARQNSVLAREVKHSIRRMFLTLQFRRKFPGAVALPL